MSVHRQRSSVLEGVRKMLGELAFESTCLKWYSVSRKTRPRHQKVEENEEPDGWYWSHKKPKSLSTLMVLNKMKVWQAIRSLRRKRWFPIRLSAYFLKYVEDWHYTLKTYENAKRSQNTFLHIWLYSWLHGRGCHGFSLCNNSVKLNPEDIKE